MASAVEHKPLHFTSFHLFAGIGGGSLGAAMARANWMGVPGLIKNVGAIDVDPMACIDYQNFTGSSITCMDLFDREQYSIFHGQEPPEDWHEATAADIRKAAGGNCPDVVFTSPPCKGFSGLLPTKDAESAKYQALNRLTVRSIRLTMEAFSDALPRIILFENVPRIKSRGKFLLGEIKEVLKQYGYVFHEADHDCGVIGGLGQHRKRYLLIARHKTRCKPFVYQPPQLQLKSIGDVIAELPLPDDPSMGPMHRLPRLKWLTWLRLALIPAGGDWRDLQKIAPEEYRITWSPRGESSGGAYSVQDWNKASNTIIGNSRMSGSSPATVSDPRLKMSGEQYGGSPGLYGVNKWCQPAPAVTGSASVSSSNCPSAIDDPRLPKSKGIYPNRFRVVKWEGQAPVVTGDTDVQCGAPSICDPRLNHKPRPGCYNVLGMSETCGAITGGQGVGVSNGPQAVADSRIPDNNVRLDPPPIILSLDGSWHRPLTTMELLALQSFPLRFADGRPVVLAGKSDSAWRERIGNAVPPEASRRVFEQICLALIKNALGETFTLASQDTPLWVNQKQNTNYYLWRQLGKV